jgi:hypothetical protein
LERLFSPEIRSPSSGAASVTFFASYRPIPSRPIPRCRRKPVAEGATSAFGPRSDIRGRRWGRFPAERPLPVRRRKTTRSTTAQHRWRPRIHPKRSKGRRTKCRYSNIRDSNTRGGDGAKSGFVGRNCGSAPNDGRPHENESDGSARPVVEPHDGERDGAARIDEEPHGGPCRDGCRWSGGRSNDAPPNDARPHDARRGPKRPILRKPSDQKPPPIRACAAVSFPGSPWLNGLGSTSPAAKKRSVEIGSSRQKFVLLVAKIELIQNRAHKRISSSRLFWLFWGAPWASADTPKNVSRIHRLRFASISARQANEYVHMNICWRAQ